MSKFTKWADKWYMKRTNTEQRRLNRQRDNCIKEAKRCRRILKKRPRVFRNEIDFIDKKIIPYIKRMKHTPGSYHRMLNWWECRHNRLEGDKNG